MLQKLCLEDVRILSTNSCKSIVVESYDKKHKYIHTYIYENELETVVVTERQEAELEVEVEEVKLAQQSDGSG